MKPGQKNPWIISPKSLIKLLGVEYDILQRAGAGVLGKFYLSAISIVIIIFVCFGSVRYAINLLFHGLLTEICLSVFFSLLFAFIYIFLINTFSKEQRAAAHDIFNLSNIIRTIFIVFIAYLVAQPLAIAMAGKKLDIQTSSHKKEVLTAHIATCDAFFARDLDKLTTRITYCRQQKENFATGSFDEELKGLERAINLIAAKKLYMAAEARNKIEGSSFFLYRIHLATNYVQSWVITVLVVLLFLLPGYLIYSISADDAYYTLKKNYEKEIVIGNYKSFEWQYREIFQTHYGCTVEIFSRFDDPPFKRRRRLQPTPGSSEDFVKKYITAAE